ncbi:hypothetical protein K503DRAFT_734422 [Rhizopogon vinicolor AM-OR11-026]|uniref:Thioredoxin-like fold domain-containing protein n=1 Tax=Rhizopogon vinicolor AM-OR11-026 TaxID=1314800 RepID=A0A1B7NB34_9AGAM|nr:hypothetical protein K503DRAFT_734422 [Rhizopogon vinicolor AM-OR11-026]
MALQPSLRSMIIAGAYDAPHTLDIFLDYVCPFSAKLSFAIDNVLKPLVDVGGQYYGKVKVIMRLQVQPWHATSTYTHEAGLAVARAAPEKFWPFSIALFKQQAEFFDIPSSTMTALQIREKLGSIAAQLITEEQMITFKELLTLKPTPNGGNAVTDDLKYTVKFSRQNGVHVSPTVFWDGLVANQISSSWGEKEWTEFLAKNVVV